MNLNNNFPINDNNHNKEIINQVDITQNQFNAYKDRKTEPVSYNKKEKKKNYILPYLFLVIILSILSIIAVIIYIGRR